MNYLKLITQFWRLRRSKRITSKQTDLYFFLIQESNERDWENPFECPNVSIVARIDITEPTLINARNRLKQLGLIDFDNGKRNESSPVYTILYLNNLSRNRVTSLVEPEEDVKLNDEHYSINKTETKDKRKKSKDCADAPPTAHWELLVKEWFDFNQLKFKQKPSFAGADPRYLKRIVELLEKRAHDSAVPWSAENAVSRLRGFLSKAYKDAFLSKNFLLYQLERNFDKITLNHAENGTRTDRQNNNKPVPETLGDGSFGKL